MLMSRISVFDYFLKMGFANSKLNRQPTKILKLTNVIHLVLSVTLVLLGLFFYSIGAIELCLLDLVWSFINIGCLFLNKLRKYEVSKGLFLISLHGYILVVSFALNMKEVSITILVASSAIALFIYKTADYVKIALFYLIAVGNYMVIRHSPVVLDFAIQYDAETVKWAEFFGFSVSCLALTIVIYSHKVINTQNEYYLLNELRQRRKVEKALAQSKSTADKSSLAKTDFLSTIGYHIRTPLNAILGLSNLLILESPKKSQLSKLSILKSSTDSLIRLIDNLLDFNKIESGDIDIYSNEFQIRDLIEHICKSYYFKSQQRGNEFIVDIDKSIPKNLVGDEIKISQIVSNLLSNALKFTDKGKVRLEVKLKSTQNGYASVHFSVSDSGIGIAKEKIKYVFENFATNLSANGRNYSTSGSGLGLSITKRLVEVLGSEIFVESHLGKGSKFYFSLNFKIFEASTIQESIENIGSTNRNLHQIRVLLVDDNQMNLLVAETFLKRWNAKVDSVENGITAVEMAKEVAYDIILMDLQLPQISGFEAVRLIRLFNPTIPVLAITAENYGFANENFKLLGIDDVLLKPFYPDDLFAKVQGLIEA